MLFYRESENIKKLRKIVEKLSVKDATNKQVVNIFSELRKHCKDGYWDWNIRDNQKFLSPSLKAQIGYSDEEVENVHGATQHMILDEDLPMLFNELEKHFVSGGEYPFSVVVRYEHKKGNVVKILCRGQVVEWDDNNEPLRMVGSHVDVTNI